MKFIATIRELIDTVNTFESISGRNIRQMGLTSGQFDVIATLGNQPPMTCKELAEKTLMVKGNLTVILKGLIIKNLINRSINKNDSRSFLISLTPLGEKLFKQYFSAHIEYLKPIIDNFEDQELDTLKRQLHDFKSKLQQFL